MKAHNLFILLFTCTLVSLACTSCNKDKRLAGKAADGAPVDVPSSIFWNRDSLNFYAELAYKADDPKGQFVTGAAYYLQRQGDMPADFYTVSRKEADDFLMLSAGQGYQPAKDLIHCLEANNQWCPGIPETK